MTKFYTSVSRRANHILYRGYENGERVEKQVRYSPTLFELYHGREDSGYRGLYGEKLLPVHFDNMREASDHIKSYQGVYPGGAWSLVL